VAGGKALEPPADRDDPYLCCEAVDTAGLFGHEPAGFAKGCLPADVPWRAVADRLFGRLDRQRKDLSGGRGCGGLRDEEAEEVLQESTHMMLLWNEVKGKRFKEFKNKQVTLRDVQVGSVAWCREDGAEGKRSTKKG
tara:strand:+ start:78 stop:488 length:411 start_codon:yes stop_codon:yes gene_type:complete